MEQSEALRQLHAASSIQQVAEGDIEVYEFSSPVGTFQFHVDRREERYRGMTAVQRDAQLYASTALTREDAVPLHCMMIGLAASVAHSGQYGNSEALGLVSQFAYYALLMSYCEQRNLTMEDVRLSPEQLARLAPYDLEASQFVDEMMRRETSAVPIVHA